jgi:hypothetical protein
MSEINKILKNKFGIDRKSKPVQQDEWLTALQSIEEELLLQQQLVEAKQNSIEEEELQDIEEQPKPVPVLVSQTSLAEASALALSLVDMREAVKLVKDKTLPTKQETIESTQKLITDVVNNLEDMKDKTEVKEQVDEIDALRGEFSTLQKQLRQSQITIGGLSGSGGGLDPNKIAHSLLPAADDTFDLGSASKQWRNLFLGGSTLIVDGASLAADELSVLDGITAGTVAASKAVIVDVNKDISGFRNVTLTGDLTVSGDDITMGTNTAGFIMVADGTNFNPVAVSGDVTLASNGAVTIANTSVTNAMLAGSIANAKLSNSSITVADGSSTTAISLGGTITFSGTSNEVTVGESSGTITVGLPDDVTIAGDLTVNGDTTTVNTATLSVEDPLIKLASGNNSSDSLDVGFYGLYDTSSSLDLFAGLFRDANDSGKFKLFKDLQAEPTTTVNTSGTGYTVATLVATLEGNVTGNVTGNASGTAATVTGAAQANITSLGTLTTLTVDSIIINGTNIGHTSVTNAIAIASDGVVTFSQVPVLPADTIETADIQDNAVTPAKIAGAVNAQTGTAYTSVIGDAFKTVTMSNGSANKLTIPPNSSVAYAVGDRIDVLMLGSGTTSIQGGSGVTVNAVSTGTVAIAAQFAAVSCLKIATDTWVAMGNHGGVS